MLFRNRYNKMKFMNRVHFKDGEGEGGGDNGGSGGGKPEITPEVQALIDAQVAQATSGLTNKNKELLEKFTSTQSQLKKFEGVDVEGLMGLKEKIEQDEILSLLAEGKTQEALDRQTEKLQVTHQAQMEKLQNEYKALQESTGQDKELIHRLMIDNTISSDFIEANGLPEAREDILLRASRVFKVENGEVIARDEKGDIIQGENGPLTRKEWVNSLKETAPHLFPRSVGDIPAGGKAGDAKSRQEMLVAAANKGPAELRKVKAKFEAMDKKGE